MKRGNFTVVCGYYQKLLMVILLCITSAILTNAQITYQFSNPNPITINDNIPSNPYPSTINVTNVTSVISKVIVRINGFNHTFPDDVDVMLVGPGGQNAIIMSDVGGSLNTVGITLTLDDAATTQLSDNEQLVTGTFLPTNIGAGDIFPAPAPAPSGGSALSVFNGTNANGIWRLYVIDDLGIDTGTISGGWSLTITNAISGENTTAISIPESGTASPYPSAISITNHTGLISNFQVNLTNFSHTSPDDVDLMLVSPSGRRIVLMSDVGGANPVNNINLTFDDTALGFLPDNSQIVAGVYKPTDFELGDVFPNPAPAGAPTGGKLSALNGDVPNGAWQLFLVDDSGNNAGNISGGWSLAVQTLPDVIVIPTSGTAQPYPADKLITGLPGSVTKAVVTLSNFSHTSPDDVDILLVAPNGRRIVLMSDVGGNTEVGSLNLTFDDVAVANLPDSSALTSGTFKPTDFETGDGFPSPAPTGVPTGTTLNAFYGSAPNGVWKLFVVDDNGDNLGSIAGSWSLNLTTSTTACNFTINPSVQAFPITGGSGSFSINMPAGCSWSASTTSNFLTITSSPSGDGNGTVSFSVAPNMSGGREGLINISNGVLTRTFQAQQGSGCPFSLSQTAVNFSAAGGSGGVSVTAGSLCSYQGTSNAGWVQITSATQTGNGTISFNVLPNPGLNSRIATITAGARTFTVNQAGASGKHFDFDGDGKADLSIFRPETGVWWVLNSGTAASYSAVQFGISTDRITPADYDGDRKTDFSVYRAGIWYIYQSQTNTVRIDNWGINSDAPVPGDYDGDSRADLAVYRFAEGNWYIKRTTDSSFQTINFGISTDKPVPADFDGDGRTDLAVYRAGAIVSQWAVLKSSDGTSLFQQFGNAGDIAVPADYDGDGSDNLAVFRPSTGTWYTSTNPATNYGARQFGTSGDIPGAADYDGDGKADLTVFRQGVWYILNSTNDAVRTDFWGVSGDTVIPATFTAQ